MISCPRCGNPIKDTAYRFQDSFRCLSCFMDEFSIRTVSVEELKRESMREELVIAAQNLLEAFDVVKHTDPNLAEFEVELSARDLVGPVMRLREILGYPKYDRLCESCEEEGSEK